MTMMWVPEEKLSIEDPELRATHHFNVSLVGACVVGGGAVVLLIFVVQLRGSGWSVCVSSYKGITRTGYVETSQRKPKRHLKLDTERGFAVERCPNSELVDIHVW
jgi:hypothetical protein